MKEGTCSKTEIVFFDTTVYTSKGTRKIDICKYGHSNDNSGNKREVVISLVVDEHRIPITHKVRTLQYKEQISLLYSVH